MVTNKIREETASNNFEVCTSSGTTGYLEDDHPRTDLLQWFISMVIIFVPFQVPLWDFPVPNGEKNSMAAIK